MAQLATLLVIAFIVYALWRDFRQNGRFSAGAWISFIWIVICASRPLVYWIRPRLAVAFNQRLGWQQQSIDTIQNNPLDRNVILVLMVLGLAVLISRRQRFHLRPSDNAWLIAFFVYCLVSILWSGFPGIAFKRWMRFAGDVIVVLLILTEIHPEEEVHRIMRRVAILLLPLSILFIKYYGELGRIYTTYGTQMWVGVTGHKNSLGILCAFSGIVLVWRGLSKWPKVDILDAGLLGLVAFLLIGSKSMTSTIVFLMGAFLLFIQSRMKGDVRKLNRQIIIGLIALLTIQAFAVFFLNKSIAPAFFAAAGRDTSFTERVPLWQELIKMGGRTPVFGSGFASFWLASDRVSEVWDSVNWTPTTAHNGYIEIFLDLGIVGLLILFSLLAQSYKNILRSFDDNPELGKLKVVLFAMVFFHNFTESSFGKPFVLIWLLFLLSSIVIRTRSGPEIGA